MARRHFNVYRVQLFRGFKASRSSGLVSLKSVGRSDMENREDVSPGWKSMIVTVAVTLIRAGFLLKMMAETYARDVDDLYEATVALRSMVCTRTSGKSVPRLTKKRQKRGKPTSELRKETSSGFKALDLVWAQRCNLAKDPSWHLRKGKMKRAPLAKDLWFKSPLQIYEVTRNPLSWEFLGNKGSFVINCCTFHAEDHLLDQRFVSPIADVGMSDDSDEEMTLNPGAFLSEDAPVIRVEEEAMDLSEKSRRKRRKSAVQRRKTAVIDAEDDLPGANAFFLLLFTFLKCNRPFQMSMRMSQCCIRTLTKGQSAKINNGSRNPNVLGRETYRGGF